MKQYFLYALALIVPLVLAGWILFVVGRALLSMLQDHQLGKELDQLKAGAEMRRQQRREENARRLANGCEHDFASPAFGLPPQACRKCGIEKERPVGQCDHAWKMRKGAVPGSDCEKCGRTYSDVNPSGESA
jgi:hypothetical protein